MKPKGLFDRPQAVAPRGQRRPRRGRGPALRLRVEELEGRCLLSAVPLAAVEADDTLDRAHLLGDAGDGPLAAVGSVGDGASSGNDVDWFQFTLGRAARVRLAAVDPMAGAFAHVLSVYNADPWAFSDPDNGIGHRRLGQSEAAALERTLAAGTYWVAVSGEGNRWFHPFVAGSGLPGLEGDYELSVEATPLPAGVNTTPTLLGATPGQGTAAARSPLVIRLNYNAPLDPALDLGSTQLVYSPTSNLTGPDALPVGLATFYFSPEANELQLYPASPLRPGHYGVFLADGGVVPTLKFRVEGVESGMTGDTAAQSQWLGDLTEFGHVHVPGVIGDDAAYDPNGPDVNLMNSASDVDLYHFRVTGTHRYAFVAEVFAGRLGSRLDPGVSLFRYDPSDGRLHLVAGNDSTRNPTVSTNGLVPFYTDAVVYAGLTAGDYYVAVSSAFNVPQPIDGLRAGENGIFDPNTPYSGTNGTSTGSYLLNLGLYVDEVAPEVVGVKVLKGATGDGPPTHLRVTFSEAVNLEELAFQAFEQAAQLPIWIEGPNGESYSPRLESYDPDVNEAVFLLLDGLGNGAHALHLSGPLGLTDFAGNELLGNAASGDFEYEFTVAGPDRGSDGDPLRWESLPDNDNVLDPQTLGPLFAHELEQGVTFFRDADDEALDTADSFRFEVLQNRVYILLLDAVALPPGFALTLTDVDGNPVPATLLETGDVLQAHLPAGSYVVTVGGWQAQNAGTVAYQMQMVLGTSGDNPSPLTIGPRPASATYLVGVASGNRQTQDTTVLPEGLLPSSPTATGPAVARTPAAVPPEAATPATLATVQNGVAAAMLLAVNSPVTLGGAVPAATGDVTAVTPASGGPVTLPSLLLANLGASPVGGVEETVPQTPPVVDAIDLRTIAETPVPPPATPAAAVAAPKPDWLANLWADWQVDVPAAAVVSPPAAVEESQPVEDEARSTALDTTPSAWAWSPAVLAASAALAVLYHQRRSTSEAIGEKP